MSVARFISIGLLACFCAHANPMPIGKQCSDENTQTAGLSIESVTPSEGKITVKVQSIGEGKAPEYAVILISSSLQPGLEYVVATGQTGSKETQVVTVPLDKAGKGSNTFATLNPRLAYMVYAMGYRCDYRMPGSKFRTRWVTMAQKQERVLFAAKANGISCKDAIPYLERIDLRSNDGVGPLGTVFFFRTRNCGTSKNPSTPYENHEAKPFSNSDPYNPGISVNLTGNVVYDYADVLRNMSVHSMSSAGLWSWMSEADKASWIYSYLYIPGNVPDLVWKFTITKNAQSNPIFSVPTWGKSYGWVDDASKRLAGLLQSPKGASQPAFTSDETNNGKALRLISAASLNQFGISAEDGRDIISFMNGWWNSMKEIDPTLRIDALTTPENDYFEKWLSDGFWGGIVPELTVVDQSASPFGWSIVAKDLVQGLAKSATVNFSMSPNIDLFARVNERRFIKLNSTAMLSQNGMQEFAIPLNQKISSEDDIPVYDAISSGVWIRANSISNGSQATSTLEPYLVKVCNSKMTCNLVRGSVQRAPIFSETVDNTSAGIRRRNIAEMLPGENRKFALESDFHFKSGTGPFKTASYNCKEAGSSCPFTLQTLTDAKNSFLISSPADALPTVDSLYILMQKGADDNIFVANIPARILGKTQMIVVGGANDPDQDAVLIAYKKASEIYRDYLLSKGGVGMNIRYVSCFDKIDGNTPIDCSANSLNNIISKFSGRDKFQLDAISYFGHGSEDGYPILKKGIPWRPDPAVNSFDANARFTSFACNGAHEGGLSAFIGAWGVDVIANNKFTKPFGLKRSGAAGWIEMKSAKDAEDVVFISTPIDPEKQGETILLDSRKRRGIILPKRNEYDFKYSYGSVDPNTGNLTVIMIPYALDDYQMFKAGSNLDFPVLASPY